MSRQLGLITIITKNLSFAHQETVFTRLRYKENLDFELDDYNIRNLQHGIIKVNGKNLNVLNHHGHHVPGHKNGNDETMRQCKIITDYVAKLEGPIILTGDFNLSPTSESLEQINSVLRNLSTEAGLTTTRTQLTNKTEVCDYIFVSKDVKVNKFWASEKLVSDHQALLLEFDI